jgi:hypothetical protein
MDWTASDVDTVVLRVEADAERFLMPGMQAALGFDRVDRTVRIRVERLR